MSITVSSDLLEACVLSVISRNKTYGYELTQQIQSVIEISESTLYPVLRRLNKQNFLDIEDMPCDGRNRRYYIINENGKDKLLKSKLDWELFKCKIDDLMGVKGNG